jgi:DNA-directed RNA polymerase specialized sigma24 family protein
MPVSAPCVSRRLRSVPVYFREAVGLGVSSRTVDDGELEGLVLSAAGGDEEAWGALWSHLEPRLSALLRKRTFVAFSRRDDDCGDVVLAIMGRLRENGFHRLHLYLAARREDPAMSFMRWLVVVAKRVAIDCLRGHPDYVDHRRSATADEAPGVWIDTEELPVDDGLSGKRLPMTNRVAAQQILRYAAGVLSDLQRKALELWAEQVSSDEIARVLGLDGAESADRLIHSAVERLRRHFR